MTPSCDFETVGTHDAHDAPWCTRHTTPRVTQEQRAGGAIPMDGTWEVATENSQLRRLTYMSRVS